MKPVAVQERKDAGSLLKSFIVGKSISLLPPQSATPSAQDHLVPSRTVLSAANGTPLRNLGRFDFSCQAKNGPNTTISAIVSPDIVDALIGRRDLISLGILPSDFPAVHMCTAMIAGVDVNDTKPPTHDRHIKSKDFVCPPKKQLSDAQIADIERTMTRIEEKVDGNAERVRTFLFNSADVMVSSLGDAAGSMTGGPDGKYRPLVAPMGWKGSGDVFSLRTDLAFEDLKRKKWIAKIIDDICVQAVNLPELLNRLEIIIQRCREKGIKLSIKKFEIGQSVKFAGFIVSSTGMRPDPNKLMALRNFPTPKSLTDLRSFLGLANQLGAFIPDLQHSTVKMRELLKKTSAWLWLPEHEAEFCKAKDLLTSPALVQPFDPSLQTQLLTDASRLHGLGFALIQRERALDGKGKIRLIQCGSCALSPAQKNYATIELELTAIWFAVQKCSYYLRGMPEFEVITDHRPLLGVFGKPLASLNNSRLQRLCENLNQFSFSVTWSAGKNHLIADALSRFPVFAPDPTLEIGLCATISEFDPSFTVIANNTDDDYVKLRDCIERGYPLPRTLSPYGEDIHELRIGEEAEKGLVLLGQRLVVPRPARKKILELLHLSHSGITKTIELAKQLYYWPGMANEIDHWVRRCSVCVRALPSQAAEPVLSGIEVASAPMEAVSVDLFDFGGKSFLVMVDRFSGYPFVAMMNSISKDSVFKKLRAWLNEVGFPRLIKSDGGPQFRQKFGELCTDFGILVETSSPYNPRSNGLAEAAVKQVKGLLKKMNGVDGAEFREALLEWRSTPRADGHSPAAAGFFGRHLRTRLPSARSLEFRPDLRDEVAMARKVVDERRVVAAAGHTLARFNVGDYVHIQHPIDKTWSFRAGTVREISKSGRSYTINTSAGQFIRNRRFLRLAPTQEAHGHEGGYPWR